MSRGDLSTVPGFIPDIFTHACQQPFRRSLDTGLRPEPFLGRAPSLLPRLLAAIRTGLPSRSDELTNTTRSTTSIYSPFSRVSAGRTPRSDSAAGACWRSALLPASGRVPKRPEGGFQVPRWQPRRQRVRLVDQGSRSRPYAPRGIRDVVTRSRRELRASRRRRRTLPGLRLGDSLRPVC